MAKKRLTRDEQVAAVQDALSSPSAKKAELIEARAAKKQQEEEVNDYRSNFSLFWAQNKKAYGMAKDGDIEQILWLHLRAAGFDNPEKFAQGIKHFGLKK